MTQDRRAAQQADSQSNGNRSQSGSFGSHVNFSFRWVIGYAGRMGILEHKLRIRLPRSFEVGKE